VSGFNDEEAKECTTEPSVHKPSSFEAEVSIGKFKGYKSAGTGQNLTEPTQARRNTVLSGVHKLFIFLSISENKYLPEQCNRFIIVNVHNKRDKTDCNNYRGT
jgi:hypothetical protein